MWYSRCRRLGQPRILCTSSNWGNTPQAQHNAQTQTQQGCVGHPTQYTRHKRAGCQHPSIVFSTALNSQHALLSVATPNCCAAAWYTHATPRSCLPPRLPTCTVGSMVGPHVTEQDLRWVCTDTSGNRMTWWLLASPRLDSTWLATVDSCLPVLQVGG